MEREIHRESLRRIKRERKIYFSPAWPGCGHMAAACSMSLPVHGTVYNVHWPILAIKSLSKSVVQMMCPCFTPMRHPLPLLQPYQNFYNAGETALSREPTLQRLLLLRGCLVPPLGPAAFVAFCTTGAVCAFLRGRS